MNRIETDYEFPQIDFKKESYLEACTISADDIKPYGFQTVSDLRQLLAGRLPEGLSDSDILEIAKETFRNKPREAVTVITQKERDVVDFIYQL